MSKPSRLAASLVCFALAQASLADTIHKIENGAYQHHQSGWIFPDRIGDFLLVGVPSDIDGTVDVAASYARVSNGLRTVASISVYPPDSAAAETTMPASIKDTPVAFEASGQPRLRATKLIHEDGTSSRAAVYFIDTGAWIVKISASVPAMDEEMASILDTFVRSQRWDSLQLSSASCTGAACR